MGSLGWTVARAFIGVREGLSLENVSKGGHLVAPFQIICSGLQPIAWFACRDGSPLAERQEVCSFKPIQDQNVS